MSSEVTQESGWKRWQRFILATFVGACAGQVLTAGLFALYQILRKAAYHDGLAEFPVQFLFIGLAVVIVVVLTNLYFLSRGYFDEPLFFDSREHIRGLGRKKNK